MYDQFGEEGLKGGGPPPNAGEGSFGGFPGGASFSGFPGGGGTTFTFTSSGPGARGFSPTDPHSIFEQFFSSSGLGGGLGGMRSAFPMDEDDPMSGSSFFSSMPPGSIPRRTTRRQTRDTSPSKHVAPGEVTRPLKLTLEELYNGTTKHLKVSRRTQSGQQQEKILEIPIQPGYKSATKIRFPRAGNENEGGEGQDLVFVVEEKPHDRFSRDGSDLITSLDISLVDALTGSGETRTVDHLSGKKVQVKLPPSVVKPGAETRVPGEGMPMRKEGSVQKKGDLIVRWNIVFPDRLTASQKEGLKKVLG